MLRPMGQASWDAHAAHIADVLSRFQIHVEPDWLFALCSRCGFQLEQLPPSDVGAFRCAVATHECARLLESEPATAVEGSDCLF